MKKNIARQLGIWSSIFIAVLGAVYLVMLIVFFATEGFTFPPGKIVQLMGGIITFLTGSGLVVLFTAIHYVKDRENKVLGSLGISFITLFAAMVSINRFVQLTVVQQSPAGAATPDLARFIPYATDSVMFALEMLGWGFFSSLAALAVAPLFSGSRLSSIHPLDLRGLRRFLVHERDRIHNPNAHHCRGVHCLGSDPAGVGGDVDGVFCERDVRDWGDAWSGPHASRSLCLGLTDSILRYKVEAFRQLITGLMIASGCEGRLRNLRFAATCFPSMAKY